MGLDLRPNLIIAGAQKAGTTTLATRLAAHPHIYMPPEKELNFFTKTDWFLDIDTYLRRFENGAGAVYRLDATPGYLWTERNDMSFSLPRSPNQPSIPASIKSLLGPKTKIIIILRHPCFRAISAFFHQFRMGRVGSHDRIRNLDKQFGLIDIGFYSDHLDNYYKIFHQDNIRVYFLEQYARNKVAYDRDIFKWLSLDSEEINKVAKEDSNANFKIEFADGVLRLCGGIEQVVHLKHSDNRYKKMLAVNPPIVEEEDMNFLNRVYFKELQKMYRMFPDTHEIWSVNPSLSDY
jgi:hypothetical protein